jgi:diacylglycerol kinase family enzyme
MNHPWVAIQRNPRSGSGRALSRLSECVARLEELGFAPQVFVDRDELARKLDSPTERSNLVCLVAAGGDGTVAELVNRYPGVRLAVLPLGTENLLAKHLGISRSGRFVAEVIARGRTRILDLCEVNERRCVLMMSCGFDADVIHRLHASRSGHITRLTYLQPIWQSLRKYDHPEMRLYVDGAEAPFAARLAVFANMPVYAFGLPVAKTARDDDGRLDLRLFQPSTPFQMMGDFCKVALNLHERSVNVTSLEATDVRVESDIPVPIQIDGDPFGFTPATVRVLRSALEVFVP